MSNCPIFGTKWEFTWLSCFCRIWKFHANCKFPRLVIPEAGDSRYGNVELSSTRATMATGSNCLLFFQVLIDRTQFCGLVAMSHCKTWRRTIQEINRQMLTFSSFQIYDRADDEWFVKERKIRVKVQLKSMTDWIYKSGRLSLAVRQMRIGCHDSWPVK